eukprot:8577612-Lingulodinium_polyedra.AAC.1
MGRPSSVARSLHPLRNVISISVSSACSPMYAMRQPSEVSKAKTRVVPCSPHLHLRPQQGRIQKPPSTDP